MMGAMKWAVVGVVAVLAAVSVYSVLFLVPCASITSFDSRLMGQDVTVYAVVGHDDMSSLGFGGIYHTQAGDWGLVWTNSNGGTNTGGGHPTLGPVRSDVDLFRSSGIITDDQAGLMHRILDALGAGCR